MNNRKTEPVLLLKANETIKKYGMLDGKKGVLVGASGGADSMALMHFLCSKREQFGIKVCAAHINHGIRGKEAERDESYVREWCEKNSVELFVLHADVKSRAHQMGETVEEAGRRVRYSFFKEVSDKIGFITATAHTLSDSIETFLLNFARGTGLRGLCGIPPVRDGIIRPLIRCTRSDVEEYCQFYGIKYLDDSTNFSKNYSRNRVRLDIVPKLYLLNPALDKAAARLFDSLEEDKNCLETLAEEKLSGAMISEGEYLISKLLVNSDAAVLNRCVSIAAERFTSESQEAFHIKKIAEFIRNGSGKIEIKSGCFADVKNGILRFYRKSGDKIADADFCFPLEVGVYENHMYKLVISPISRAWLKNFKNINKAYFKNAVDCDKIRGNALVQSKSAGDKMVPAGRNVSKTLKKLFNEIKVPVEVRPYIPVAKDESGVIWVANVGVSERCKVTEETKNAILLEVNRLEV